MTVEGRATERADLGPLAAPVEDELERLATDDLVHRLWSRDHTLWQPEPREVADRLGWLDSPTEMAHRVGEIEAFAAGVAGNGMTHVVVLGMGGSSLFPEVVGKVFGEGPSGIELLVLDTTDPAAVARIETSLPLESTLFVAASKSGTTIETRSQLAYFLDRTGSPEQFVAVTDPGTPLGRLARDRGFRAVFENRPDVGGRYSALTHFGLVPAALVGVGLEELLERARGMVEECRSPSSDNPGVELGAILGVAAREGRDVLTLQFGEGVAPFGAWIEQLVAESTGKQGTGILPVDGEPPRAPSGYGPDRVFVRLGAAPRLDALAEHGHPVVSFPCDDPYDLGGEVFRWEVATAVAGRILGINPFDQPDVQAAKDATARVLAGGAPEITTTPLEAILEALPAGGYLAVNAFVDPGSEVAAALRRATFALGARLGVPATFGVGPRYLHSTGQLHKGGPPRGVFVQVVGSDSQDLPIPGAGYGFSELKWAQAAGDLEALRERGFPAARVEPDEVIDAGS